ncbi:hypothetical protein [Actinomyces vulturis]|uniref:hypothetical protein n=1 Tax=Actinomyces vulturis TaxID=1857645 RepID=UPI001146CCF5|nr:hypothetical protein [Actinomyces vulturis]
MTDSPTRTVIKAHAADDDVLVLVDPDCTEEISESWVRELCDRRSGIGADVFVRLARTSAMPGGEAYLTEVPEAEWFVDAYKADGQVSSWSLSGQAVATSVLTDDEHALAHTDADGSLVVGTRMGACSLTRMNDAWIIDAGFMNLHYPHTVSMKDGWDTTVTIPGMNGVWAGLTILTPQPCLVVAVPDADESRQLARALATNGAVRCEPELPDGCAVALMVALDEETLDTASTADEGDAVMMRAALDVLSPQDASVTSWLGAACACGAALSLWNDDPLDGVMLVTPHGEIAVNIPPTSARDLLINLDKGEEPDSEQDEDESLPFMVTVRVKKIATIAYPIN